MNNQGLHGCKLLKNNINLLSQPSVEYNYIKRAEGEKERFVHVVPARNKAMVSRKRKLDPRIQARVHEPGFPF
jgi:hypothetical protein